MAVDFELYALFPEHKLALCIVPKVASMSIIQAIHDMYGVPVKTPTHKNGVFKWYTQKQVETLIPDWRTAIFVRHPEERLKSAYRYLILQGGLSCSGNLRSRFSKKDTFEQFVKKVLKNPLYDPHYMPQSRMGNKFDFVGKIETMSEDWGRFVNWSELALPDIPHVNKSRSKSLLEIPRIDDFRRVYADDYSRFGYE